MGGMAWHSMALYGCCCKHTISRNERYTRFTVGKSFFFSFYSRFSTSLFAFTQPPRECEHVFVFASWRYPIVCVHTENVWKRFCTRYTYRMLCCMPFVAVCFLFFSRCSLSMLLMEMNFVDGRESTDFLQRLAAVVRYNQVFSIKPAFVCILRENCDCVLLIIFIGEVLRTTSTTTTRQTATIEFVWEVSISVLRLYRSHCILRHFVVCFLHGPIHIQAVSKQQRLNNNNDRFHFSTD